MRLPFLRQPGASEPLVVAMTGARLGERIVYTGATPARLIPLAAKAGLSGRVVALGPAERTAVLEQAAQREGVLAEPAAELSPQDLGMFDLAVLDLAGTTGPAIDRRPAIESLASALRPGGRLIAIEPGVNRGIAARLFGGDAPRPTSDLVPLLEAAGLRGARVIADQDGLRFVEAVRPGQSED